MKYNLDWVHHDSKTFDDEILKKANLLKDYELTCYKNYELKQENEKLKTFIDEIVKTLKHCKLNGTNKLDIVAEFIEKEYNEQINGNDEE